MIKKILVAFDGSHSADKALDFALDVAGKYSAEIMILNVFTVPNPSLVMRGTVFAPESTEKYLEELRRSHEKVLLKAFKKSKKFSPKIEVSKKLLEGRPADKIVETAREGGFDLVVLGSRGLGGIKEIFLGSVSDRVADEAPCPVLIVKDKVNSG